MESVTNKEILDYLLGKSKIENDDNFLAICFSTDENAEKFEMVREDLVESYLSGQLSKENRLQFETYFLKDEQNLEFFEFAKNLREHLKENRQLEVTALSSMVKKTFSIGSLLIPVGGFAVFLIAGFFIWNVAAKRNNLDIAGLKPTPTTTPTSTPVKTPTPQPTVLPTPSLSPNRTNTNLVPANTPKPTETPKTETPTPTPKSIVNPILAIALSMMAKGGNQKIDKITKDTKQVVLKTAKPYEENPDEPEFTEYQATISNNGKMLWSSGFEKLKPDTNDQISITVPPQKLETGNLKFIMIGKRKDGTTKELNGTKRMFSIKKEK
jgi:hypothetical protein